MNCQYVRNEQAVDREWKVELIRKFLTLKRKTNKKQGNTFWEKIKHWLLKVQDSTSKVLPIVYFLYVLAWDMLDWKRSMNECSHFK